MPQKFDVIIANPPYVKQEHIPNKSQLFKNLPIYAAYRMVQKKLEKNAKPPKVKLTLTGKTDYYGFFLWYSTFFLKDHGILCFIIPNKWMDVKYGEEIKQFLLDNYQIKAIVGYNKNVFADAQVSTVILLIQKESDPSKRADSIARFLMISSDEGKDQLESLVYSSLDPDSLKSVYSDHYSFENPSADIQCTLVHQGSMDAAEKWSFKYLFQSEFARLLSKQNLILLNNEEISFGFRRN